jgi:hypothetical protein
MNSFTGRGWFEGDASLDEARITREKSRAIKSWVRDLLDLSDEAIVMVSEIQCLEVNCPPVETLIVVWTGDIKQQAKIPAPLSEVSLMTLENLVQKMQIV